MTYRKGQVVIEEQDAALIGKLLRCWCVLHDVSNEDMARALGTGKSGLSRIKHGKRPLTVEMALEICRLTGMAIDARGVSLDDTGELDVAR
jgi:plasmid maintenance system antidote protein VapI